MTRPFFRDHRTAAVVGVVLFAAGAWCLYDAWERRGAKPPWPVRVVSVW